MFIALVMSAMMLAPSDTLGCGDYNTEALAAVVTQILTGEGEHADSRAYLGLDVQPDTTSGYVESDDAVCEPLVQYFVTNMASLTDEEYLNTHGWNHAVMRFGAYRTLLIVPRAPVDIITSRRSLLLFFDDADTFVSYTTI